MLPFPPVDTRRYSVRKGDAGFDVWTLQLNLAILGFTTTFDGYFGDNTELVVKGYQAARGLIVDGVVGFNTCKKIALELTTHAHDAFNMPDGLLSSVLENESGGLLWAYTPHPSDSGYDVFVYQAAFPPWIPTDINLTNAASVKWLADNTAQKLRTQKDTYFLDPVHRYIFTAGKNVYSWQLGTNYHNWPVASENLARFAHIYPTDPARDNEPADWILIASGGRLATPHEWVTNYIAKCTQFVKRWRV